MLAARKLSLSLSRLKPLATLNSFSLLVPYSKSSAQNIRESVHPSINLFRYLSSAAEQNLPLSRDGNYDDGMSQSLHICPGCGVYMQDFNPKHPGFFIKPSKKDPTYRLYTHLEPVAQVPEFSNSIKSGLVIEPERFNGGDLNAKLEKPVVCVRCHSLRHYGKVKDPTVENLLPDFDFNHTVGRKLGMTTGSRSVVVMVVDVTDFDGSFPRKIANLVSKTIDDNSSA